MTSQTRIDTQNVLVTGARQGIGLEVCRQLARQGLNVILTAQDAAKAEVAVQQLANEGLTVRAFDLDVTQEESVRQCVAMVSAEYSHLDVLINNAAAYANWSEVASTANLSEVHRVFETNLYGPWRMCQAFLPLLRKSAHARIVNVASGAGSHGELQFGLTANRGAAASYAISKAALLAFNAKLAAELDGTGILVNAVDPGLTATAPGMEAMGARPIPEGAASVIWAALLPDDGPSGGFFRDGKPLPW